MQIEQRIAEGGSTVTLTDEEKLAAAAVVDEWCQSRAAPAAARDLRRVLAPDQAYAHTSAQTRTRLGEAPADD